MVSSKLNEVKVFSNTEFGDLQIVNIDGKEYFPASDCAKILGYKNPRDAILKHCRSVAKYDAPHPQSKTKTIEVNIISEGDLYRLIVHSKLPDAEKFEKWVFEEVLPSIRQTGGYIPIQEDDDEKSILAKAVLIANKTIEKKDKLIEEMKPKVELADRVLTAKNSILVREFAKMLKNDGYDIGEKRLFAWLRNNGILMSNNEPYQKYMHHFEVVERHFGSVDETKTSKTTRVRPSGQLYIIKKLKEKGLI